MKARAIDGPCDYTLPPYNHYAKMAPDHPNEAAAELAKHGKEIYVFIPSRRMRTLLTDWIDSFKHGGDSDE